MKRILQFGILLMLLTAVILPSCSDEPVTQTTQPGETHVQNPHRVPLNQALGYADALLSQIEGETATRSGRLVSSIKYLTQPTTRSTSGSSVIDTALYLINYANDEGFAILAADDRLHPIYAISESGSLSIEDTVENKGLALFLQDISTDIAYISEGDSIKIKPGIGGGFDPPINLDKDHTFTTLYDIKPWLNYHQRRFFQGYPYNKYCPIQTKDGVQQTCVVGCVPLACAQIMSFYKWPETFKGKSLHWENINQGGTLISNNEFKDDFPWFLNQIGLFLDAEYGIDGTGCSVKNVTERFHNFGYSKLSNPKMLSKNSCISELSHGPLLVYGSNINPSQAAHCWVIDGLYCYKESWPGVIETETGSITRTFYHCVWGWGGTGNGYFLWTGKHTLGGHEPDKYDSDDTKYPYKTKEYTSIYFWEGINPIK